jgi:hypothetical protein
MSGKNAMFNGVTDIPKMLRSKLHEHNSPRKRWYGGYFASIDLQKQNFFPILLC